MSRSHTKLYDFVTFIGAPRTTPRNGEEKAPPRCSIVLLLLTVTPRRMSFPAPPFTPVTRTTGRGRRLTAVTHDWAFSGLRLTAVTHSVQWATLSRSHTLRSVGDAFAQEEDEFSCLSVHSQSHARLGRGLRTTAVLLANDGGYAHLCCVRGPFPPFLFHSFTAKQNSGSPHVLSGPCVGPPLLIFVPS